MENRILKMRVGVLFRPSKVNVVEEVRNKEVSVVHEAIVLAITPVLSLRRNWEIV